MGKTRLSSKGHVVLPKAIRDAHGWRAGVELVVEDLPDGVRLKTAKSRKPSRIEDVFGALRYIGEPKTIEEMDAAIPRQVRRRRARGRY